MRLLLVLFAANLAGAQGTTPKASPAQYPVHGGSGGIAIGAEFMVHSFGTGEQMWVAENYLVVEVALFPPKGEIVAADPSHFALRVNGKKTPLLPQPPSMVAASLNHPEWQVQQSGPTGYPASRAPFPGAPPRAPDAGTPGGIEKKEPLKPTEVLAQTALPTDPHRGPVSGFLYFPFTGKTSSIKSLDLVWEGAALKLR